MTVAEQIGTAASYAKLASALAKAQGAFPPIPKNRTGIIKPKDPAKQAFQYKYADLEAVITATRKPLSENGLAVIQQIVGQLLLTHLIHESGESITSEMNIGNIRDYQDPKNYGIIEAYARRYAYQSLVCVAADDDFDPDEDDQAEGSAQPNEKSRNVSEAQKPAAYPDDAFKKNLPAWEKAVAEGKKTPSQIIATVESKGKLTDTQRQTIEQLKGPSNENA